ncbi:MAP3K epsilon kinase 1 [Olea europaea subsp. europaea]|uniref:MAP3K epsilon kinase 1 n=1 Tax=Olea europaea subsp. europaea TaxID=158383 RepID=A0A8S0UGY8_OLEEU|nr:MAP3K epsilon kinase 1 [Olea europaea subsp. europaea]
MGPNKEKEDGPIQSLPKFSVAIQWFFGAELQLKKEQRLSSYGCEKYSSGQRYKKKERQVPELLWMEATGYGVLMETILMIASGVFGSGIINARPRSETSSKLLAHVVSPWKVDVTRENLEKVADLLLKFVTDDMTIMSQESSQSLLGHLFQMSNKIEPPIVLTLLKCIHYLSTEPRCLENLQRGDAVKDLISNLDRKEGALVSQMLHEVLYALFNWCKIKEQAAENGIIPYLDAILEWIFKLKQVLRICQFPAQQPPGLKY